MCGRVGLSYNQSVNDVCRWRWPRADCDCGLYRAVVVVAVVPVAIQFVPLTSAYAFWLYENNLVQRLCLSLTLMRIVSACMAVHGCAWVCMCECLCFCVRVRVLTYFVSCSTCHSGVLVLSFIVFFPLTLLVGVLFSCCSCCCWQFKFDTQIDARHANGIVAI